MSVLRMARPQNRKDTKNYQFRKRIPADVLSKTQGQCIAFRLPGGRDDGECTVSVKVREIISFSLRTSNKSLAKERHAAVLAQCQQWCDSIRNGPRPLSQKQIIALAGEWYREWIARLESEPGSPGVWQHWLRILDSVDPSFVRGLAIVDQQGRLVEQVGPVVDEFLAGRQLIVDEGTRERLCVAFHDAMTRAGDTLRRYASGDYSPDTNAQRFPTWEGRELVASSNGTTPLTFDGLFERWRRETKPSPSTVTTYTGYLKKFKEHLGHNDPRRVTRADVIAFKDKLVDSGLKAKGIKDGPLAAIKSLFNYAVKNELLPYNPAAGVTVRLKATAGERMLPYTDAEVAHLLALADKETHPARRWLPWLLAATGARVGELAQLWGRRVTEIDGIPVIKIAPAEDGGSLKNEGSERDVPIHPALIKRGFIEFVREQGDGPLFYRSREKRKATTKADQDARRHASKVVANHLAAWISNQGFKDKRKARTHAFRHWFKTTARNRGIDKAIVDAIQGHAPQDVADRYRHVDLATMVKAIKRIPVPPPVEQQGRKVVKEKRRDEITENTTRVEA